MIYFDEMHYPNPKLGWWYFTGFYICKEVHFFFNLFLQGGDENLVI